MTSEWISVKERLPELTETDCFGRKTRRIYFVVKGNVLSGRADPPLDDMVFWPDSGGNGFLMKKVSHWMPNPLPAPPKETL